MKWIWNSGEKCNSLYVDELGWVTFCFAWNWEVESSYGDLTMAA